MRRRIGMEHETSLGRKIKKITLLFTIVLFSACSTVVKNPTPLSALKTQPGPVSQKEYVIQQGDLLDIKFFYNQELNETVTVRPDGRISLQLAHEVMAVGRTPEQLTDALKVIYGSELEKPEITVIVRTFSAQRVFVGGEVTTPGIVELTRPMTVLQSIVGAGGMTETGRIKEVVVIRRAANNRPMVIPVNLEKAIDGTDPAQDITLAPFDVVYVPKSTIGNVNQWVDQYIRRNIPGSFGFGFSYELNPNN